MQRSTYNELLIYRARATCGETLLYSYYTDRKRVRDWPGVSDALPDVIFTS